MPWGPGTGDRVPQYLFLDLRCKVLALGLSFTSVLSLQGEAKTWIQYFHNKYEVRLWSFSFFYHGWWVFGHWVSFGLQCVLTSLVFFALIKSSMEKLITDFANSL